MLGKKTQAFFNSSTLTTLPLQAMDNASRSWMQQIAAKRKASQKSLSVQPAIERLALSLLVS